MKIDAEIICRKEPYGVVCKWTGGKVAAVYAGGLHPDGKRIRPGDIMQLGRLKLRVVQSPAFLFENAGWCDSAAVMLESPHAQLFWLYRENAETFVRFICGIEARLRCGFRGLMLKPFREGDVMPLAAWLADKLL